MAGAPAIRARDHSHRPAPVAVTEPIAVFLVLSSVATASLVVAGTGASTLWFLWVLRTLGLRLRFAPA